MVTLPKIEQENASLRHSEAAFDKFIAVAQKGHS
jgi:hypothetical protein